jgi:hypothetical protein
LKGIFVEAIRTPRGIRLPQALANATRFGASAFLFFASEVRHFGEWCPRRRCRVDWIAELWW